MSEERAVLAGGCFWGMQELIRRFDGVVSTRVGYTGGDVPNATYRNHGTHAEAIEIIFDPARISYRKILEFFFQIHDPSTRNRQGNDVGLSYRSAIFYVDDEQKRVAVDTIADVDASGLWPGKVVNWSLLHSGLCHLIAWVGWCWPSKKNDASWSLRIQPRLGLRTTSPRHSRAAL